MESFDVVVIGGGPAGSTTASFLRKLGQRVVLLERDRFPRHHVGESMIAATIDVLAEIGLEEKLAAAGFPVKSGGCFIWGESDEPWCIRFAEVPGRPTAYQVKRDVFDQLLLDHSASLGVDVRQEHRVTQIVSENGRVVGVSASARDGSSHEFRAPYTVDASGLAAVISNRVSSRIPVEELKNVAVYGYWTGAHPAPAGLGGQIRPTDRNNIIIKWLGPGWLWFIPLGHGDRISVGYVTPRSEIPSGGGREGMERFLLEKVRSSEEYGYLLSNSKYTGEFHIEQDWSYRSQEMSGPGYFAVGDAACFVDPILSTGVYLATLYAKLCAIAVHTCMGARDQEGLVREWYEGLYNDTYLDYVQMARFWYRGHRRVGDWMHEAREATSEDQAYAESDRSSFIGLATGNIHAHPGYVLLRKIESLPLPVYLRKDPRAGFHREAQKALEGHAALESGALTERAAQGTRAALGRSRELKEKLARLTAPRDAVSDAFEAGPVELADEQVVALAPDARVTLEVVDDLVTVVVANAAGGRRRLARHEQTVLAGLASGARVAALAGSAPDPAAARAFLAELVGAGVAVASPSAPPSA